MSSIPRATSTTPLLAPSRGPSPQPPSRSHSLLPIRQRQRQRRRTPPIHILPALLTLTLFALVAFIAWDVSSFGNCYFAPLCRILGDGKERIDEVWWRNAGAYAPWRSLGTGGGRGGLPRGCEIDQVTVLHRHAARYPTIWGGRCMRRAMGKLANRTVTVPRRHPELTFLTKADMTLEDWKFEELMDQGRKASWRSGKEVAALYKRFLESGDGVFSRSTGGARVVETAGYWLQGFEGEPFKLKSIEHLSDVDLILPEEDTFNNTLSVHSCPASRHAPNPPEFMPLQALLEPIRDRLNDLLDPRPHLEVSDIVCLADICPYDSQAEGEDWEGWSRWCGLFTREEWEIIGHVKDAARFYQTGEGSKYCTTLGAGWINELVARLMDSAPQDFTSTNRTLDADELTFPRGGKRLFVDFTHDTEVIEILAAMGIMRQYRPPPVESVPPKRTYIISEIIPFGARLIVERIGCDLGNLEPDPEAGDHGKGKDGTKNYVRILVNDVVHAVDHVAWKQSGFVEHGMCEVDSFVESQNWAQNEVDWGVCYE